MEIAAFIRVGGHPQLSESCCRSGGRVVLIVLWDVLLSSVLHLTFGAGGELCVLVCAHTDAHGHIPIHLSTSVHLFSSVCVCMIYFFPQRCFC